MKSLHKPTQNKLASTAGSFFLIQNHPHEAFYKYW